MKVGIYNNVRVGSPRFSPYAKELGADLELIDFPCPPTRENLHLIKENGCEALIFLNDHQEDEAYFAAMKENGIRYLCTCSVGFDHFNIPAMRKVGIKGSNAAYSPNAVTEHTMLLLLGLLRHIRTQVTRIENHDYTITGCAGREIRSLKIGVIGAGKIGYTTMRALHGFTPKELVTYDPIQNDFVKEYAKFVSEEEVYQTCDVVIIHTILNDENYHMIDAKRLASMKDGAILINVSRGPLIDTDALLAAVESGKLGGLGIDVIENEGILKGLKDVDDCPHPQLKKLLEHENVLFTNHSAYFTEEADRALVRGTIQNLIDYMETDSCKFELVFKS